MHQFMTVAGYGGRSAHTVFSSAERGWKLFTYRECKSREVRYGQWVRHLSEKHEYLPKRYWMELDDVQVLSLIFESPYLMLLRDENWPIRMYDGPKILHYRNVEEFSRKYNGEPPCKGFAYGPGHFNALIL